MTNTSGPKIHGSLQGSWAFSWALTPGASLGRRRLVRPLEPIEFAAGAHEPSTAFHVERWLALDVQADTDHTVYRIPKPADWSAARRVREHLLTLSRVDNRHLPPLEPLGEAPDDGLWFVSPYVGSHTGLIDLGLLVDTKGGRLPAFEADRALTQLLDGLDAAHAAGLTHGPMGLGDVLVDTRGGALIELLGLRRVWLGADQRGLVSDRVSGPSAESVRDDVRSLVELGYGLVTGRSAEGPLVRASRLVPRLSRAWDEWFDRGLDPLEGFATAAEAAGALPSRLFESDRPSRVVATASTGRALRRLGRAFLRSGESGPRSADEASAEAEGSGGVGPDDRNKAER